MRRIKYPNVIKEDLKTIIKIENKLKYVVPRKMIQLLKILKTGECDLKKAAKIMGIAYRTAKRYWKFYKTNGINGIKNWKPTEKTKAKLSDKQLLEIIGKHQPRTLKEATKIVEKETGISYSINGIYSRFRKLKIKLKTGRPSHIKKKPIEGELFKIIIASLPEVIRENSYYADEMKIGLRVLHKRRWAPLGIRPEYVAKISYEYLHLLVFINPLKGKIYAYEMNSLKSELLKEVVKNFLREAGEDSIIIWDNAGSHKKVAKELEAEGKQNILFLPPYSPELNPVERFFQELRKVTANNVFEELSEISEFLKKEIEKWKRFPQKVTKLTAYPYIRGHL